MPTDTPSHDPVAVTGAQNYAKKLLATGMAYEFLPETIATGAYLEGYAAGAVDLARMKAELAAEKERADYAWQNTREIDAARMKQDTELAALRRDKAKIEHELFEHCVSSAQHAKEYEEAGEIIGQLRLDKARLDWLMARDSEFDRPAIDAAMKGGRDE